MSSPVSSTGRRGRGRLVRSGNYTLFSTKRFFRERLHPHFSFVTSAPSRFRVPQFFQVSFSFFPSVPSISDGYVIDTGYFFVPSFLVGLASKGCFSFVFRRGRGGIMFSQDRFSLFPVCHGFFWFVIGGRATNFVGNVAKEDTQGYNVAPRL